jgi:phenylacetic acid degradation operon negative regulatory protein
MVRPFNIEEIFPEADSARLPRRQAGSSSQGLAVTLLADYTMPARAWLPSAAIAALLEEFGVTSGAARTTISRLARRGVLEGSRQGRHSSYRLTEPAAIDLSNGGGAIAAFGVSPEPWDGLWTLVSFSIPEQESTQRRALRTYLRWWGFAPLHDGVWVWPHPLPEKAHAELAQLALGSMSLFRAGHIDLPTDANRSPIAAWDLPAIAQQYEEFLRLWNGWLPRIAAGDVTGVDAVRTRTEVMDMYRRFPVLDPMLPIELMPPGWPRARAREVFVAVYDGLAKPAQQYVQDLVLRVAGEPYPDLRAHTVAEMTAGMSPEEP